MQRVYSFIIPVYNRPLEIQELLESFVAMTSDVEYEIVIVEDGSTEKSEGIVQQFKSKLSISYFFKPNSGPGDSRNYGMKRASGNYFIILDSDCILPTSYLYEVEKSLKINYLDCFGGPDAAHSSFTPLQKAINYVMTSFLTTGGIRGNKKAVQQFEPRSFNMGISKEAFDSSGGFGKIHPGEDPDLSQRLLKMGFKTGFIEKAFVFHKRRISWSKFYNQVKKFGLVRPILSKWHPQSSKLSFWFPFLFVLYTCFSFVMLLFGIWPLLVPVLLYTLAIVLDSSIKSKSLWIGFLSGWAMFVQFFGYGLAFIKSTFYIHLLNENPRERFPHLFFD